MNTAVKYPDPILLSPAKDFDFETDKPLLKQLEAAAKTGMGWGTLVGLAAPQIGIPKRFFLALEKMYINPKIIKYSELTYKTEEGCYSLEDHKHYPVKRHEWIILTWQDRGGNFRTKRFNGTTAQVIQHEHDHLLGKLCSG